MQPGVYLVKDFAMNPSTWARRAVPSKQCPRRPAATSALAARHARMAAPRVWWLALALLFTPPLHAMIAAEPSDDTEAARALLAKAQAALADGKIDEALALASRAVESAPGNPQVRLARARLYSQLRNHEAAVADCDACLKLDESLAEAWHLRACERFKLNRIEESLADFDRFVRLRPSQERELWQRGIAYYYAGRYAEGAKQFEAYQTFDDNDVENVVWRYICQARATSPEEARRQLYRVRHDMRVPMMEIYAVYAGQAQPTDVLAAAESGSVSPEERTVRRFYAHLYLGLYFEAQGNHEQARQHLFEAEKLKISHYMWDVCRVHCERLRAADAPNTSEQP